MSETHRFFSHACLRKPGPPNLGCGGREGHENRPSRELSVSHGCATGTSKEVGGRGRWQVPPALAGKDLGRGGVRDASRGAYGHARERRSVHLVEAVLARAAVGSRAGPTLRTPLQRAALLAILPLPSVVLARSADGGGGEVRAGQVGSLEERQLEVGVQVHLCAVQAGGEGQAFWGGGSEDARGGWRGPSEAVGEHGSGSDEGGVAGFVEEEAHLVKVVQPLGRLEAADKPRGWLNGLALLPLGASETESGFLALLDVDATAGETRLLLHPCTAREEEHAEDTQEVWVLHT